MAASSALLIACRPGCDLISMGAVVLVLGLTIPTPKIGLLLTCDSSVYTKSRDSTFGCGVLFRVF